jgi:putative flippase GtrA
MALASKLKSNSKFPKFLIAGIFLIIVAVTAYTLLQSGPWIVP